MSAFRNEFPICKPDFFRELGQLFHFGQSEVIFVFLGN